MIRRNPATLVIAKNKPWQPAHVVPTDAARMVAQGIVDTIREPPLVLDRGLRTVGANRAVAALVRQLNALVVTESGSQGTCISITHQGAQAV